MKRLIVTIGLMFLIAGYALGQNVEKLVRQARKGNSDAYRELAICYRDGCGGLEASWFNMICMCELYSMKTNDVDIIADVVKEKDVHHPFRLLADALDMPEFNDEAIVLVKKLADVAPPEAEAVYAAQHIYNREDTSRALSSLSSLVNEGSELAAIFISAYYESSADLKAKEESYLLLARKYPVFNLLLGDIQLEKYASDRDFKHVESAIEYIYKADFYGMLTPYYANKLLGLYHYFSSEGLLDCNRKEETRLRKVRERAGYTNMFMK